MTSTQSEHTRRAQLRHDEFVKHELSVRSVHTTPDGQLIEEMTEEEEQEIYELPLHVRRSPSPPRRGFMQRLTAIRHNAGNHGGATGGGLETSHSSTGRLQASYALLEDEYCKLKFAQTELVALADQRKMEKQRSTELMESLEEDLRARGKENSKLRFEKEQLQEALEDVPQVFESMQEEHESNHELNTLWLKRDLAQHKVDEGRDELLELREETRQLLEALQLPPVVPASEVKRELYRLKKEQKVKELEKYQQDLKDELSRLRPPKIQSSGLLPTMIGKEILVDDPSTQDAVSVVTSTLYTR